MTTVQITPEVNIELNDVLEGVAKLETPELERFLSQVSILLAQRKAVNLPEQEANLLKKINRELPAATQQRYDELKAKLQVETITTEEHKELLELIDQIEIANAERIQHLLELAQLRKMSLNELMEQLGITPPPVHD